MIKNLLIILLFIPMLSLAQNNASISGVITDANTSALIAGVEVVILPNTGNVTNTNGEYKILNLKAGTYEIKVSHIGYETLVNKVIIKAGENLIKNFNLKVDIKNLLAVEIRDDKIETYAYSKVVLKEADLETKPVRDIADYMREVPNISAVRKGGANLDPVIRGFKFSQLNIQLDNGQKMEGGCPNRMDPTTSHIEAGDIEAIEVLKGPFALRYGQNMGGVVNILTSSPRPFDEFQVHVKANVGFESNWNGQREHMTIYGGGQKVFFSVSGNKAEYGDYEDGEGNTVRSSFNKSGYTAKLGYAPAKNHRIILSYSDLTASDVSFPSLPMDERLDMTKLYSIDYTAEKINDKIETINFKAYYSHIDHTMDNIERGSGDTVVAVANIIAQRLGYRAEVGINTSEKSHLFVGTDMFNINKDGDRVKTMIGMTPMMNKVVVKNEDLWNSAVITNFGAFAEYRYNHKLWEIVGSARVDYNTASSDSISLINNLTPNAVDIIGTPADSTESEMINFSISAGASRKLNENSSIGLSIGRGMRSPDMIERFIISLPVGYDNYEYIGNPELDAEINNEIDLVYKYNHQKLGSVEVSTFYSFVQNYIGGELIPGQLSQSKDVLGVKKFENLGNATLYGFEFSYATPNRYKFRASVTAAITQGSIDGVQELIYDDNNLLIDTKTIDNDPLGEIPPFNANVNLSYKFFNNTLIPQVNVRYSARQDRISVSMGELTTPDFALLDASIVYKYSQHLNIVVGVNNILDKSYYEHLNRRVLGTNTRLYEPGRVIFTNLILNF